MSTFKLILLIKSSQLVGFTRLSFSKRVKDNIFTLTASIWLWLEKFFWKLEVFIVQKLKKNSFKLFLPHFLSTWTFDGLPPTQRGQSWTFSQLPPTSFCPRSHWTTPYIFVCPPINRDQKYHYVLSWLWFTNSSASISTRIKVTITYSFDYTLNGQRCLLKVAF